MKTKKKSVYTLDYLGNGLLVYDELYRFIIEKFSTCSNKGGVKFISKRIMKQLDKFRKALRHYSQITDPERLNLWRKQNKILIKTKSRCKILLDYMEDIEKYVNIDFNDIKGYIDLIQMELKLLNEKEKEDYENYITWKSELYKKKHEIKPAVDWSNDEI